MRIHLVLLVSLLVAGCGRVPSGAADGQGATVLAVRRDVLDGLRYQRVLLGTDDVAPGVSSALLESIAARYRAIGGRVVGRTRAVTTLSGLGDVMAKAIAHESGTRRALPAGGAALGGIVAEYQAASKKVLGATSALLGRTPGESEDVPFYNPHIGRHAGNDPKDAT